MTDALREELARIGEAAARASVPADLWTRGRRARRRDRVVAGGAVLSVLVVLSGLGLVLGLPGRSDVPPAGPGAGAVPSVIHPVPNRLSRFVEGADETWSPSVAEEDLAIGRASVAFASGVDGRALPVAITASDGAYHPLRLPGWMGTSLAAYQAGTSGLALSPDGRHLAWGWYDRSTFEEEAVATGVRVVDLESGRVRSVALTGARGVAVSSLAWSPDSRWLVWQGAELKRWDEDHTSWKRNVAGRIAPGNSSSQPIGVSRGGDERLAIDDQGTVGWVVGRAYRFTTARHDGGDVADLFEGHPVSSGLFSPGGRLALASASQAAAATFAVPDPDGRGPWAAPWVVQTRALPDSRYPATIEPVGWLDEDHVVELVTPVHPIDQSSWTVGDSELAVMSLRDGRTPAYDVVARVERGDEQTGEVRDLTVAADLMSLDHPSRDFPAPEWPWSDERKVAVFGGAGLAVVVGLVFVVAYRRGRRLG